MEPSKEAMGPLGTISLTFCGYFQCQIIEKKIFLSRNEGLLTHRNWNPGTSVYQLRDMRPALS